MLKCDWIQRKISSFELVYYYIILSTLFLYFFFLLHVVFVEDYVTRIDSAFDRRQRSTSRTSENFRRKRAREILRIFYYLTILSLPPLLYRRGNFAVDKTVDEWSLFTAKLCATPSIRCDVAQHFLWNIEHEIRGNFVSNWGVISPERWFEIYRVSHFDRINY